MCLPYSHCHPTTRVQAKSKTEVHPPGHVQTVSPVLVGYLLVKRGGVPSDPHVQTVESSHDNGVQISGMKRRRTTALMLDVTTNGRECSPSLTHIGAYVHLWDHSRGLQEVRQEVHGGYVRVRVPVQTLASPPSTSSAERQTAESFLH